MVDDIREKIDDAVRRSVHDLVRRLHQGIVDKTPTETGRARAGWHVSVGQPSAEIPPEGQASYSVAPVSLDATDTYDTVYISNNLPYIEDLEFGSSSQAPQGMMRLTIAELFS